MLGSTRLHIAALLLITSTCNAQSASIQSKAATITEPGIYRLSELFSHADTVALVKVISGDTEAYAIPIYKGQVVQAFKGVTSGDTLYFGPYLRTELGSEYILFLENAAEPLGPKDKAIGGYGPSGISMYSMKAIHRLPHRARTRFSCRGARRP